MKRKFESFLAYHFVTITKEKIEKKKKRVASGNFVARDEGPECSWMITGIVFNYELNKRQARIIKVGDPARVDFVEPDTLTIIQKNF